MGNKRKNARLPAQRESAPREFEPLADESATRHPLVRSRTTRSKGKVSLPLQGVFIPLTSASIRPFPTPSKIPSSSLNSFRRWGFMLHIPSGTATAFFARSQINYTALRPIISSSVRTSATGSIRTGCATSPSSTMSGGSTSTCVVCASPVSFSQSIGRFPSCAILMKLSLSNLRWPSRTLRLRPHD